MTDNAVIPSRRGLLAAAASGLAVAATSAAAAPKELNLADIKKEADVACVYHCDFGEAARFDQMLTNIANHYSAYGADPFALQLTIVAHGAGVKFFLKDLEGTSWVGDRVSSSTSQASTAVTGGLRKNRLAAAPEPPRSTSRERSTRPTIEFRIARKSTATTAWRVSVTGQAPSVVQPSTSIGGAETAN